MKSLLESQLPDSFLQEEVGIQRAFHTALLTPGKGTFQTCNSEAGLALGYKTRVGLAMLLRRGIKRTVKRCGVGMLQTLTRVSYAL